MFGNKKIMAVGAVCAGLLLPAQAAQAATAIAGVDLNLRVGPGTAYGAIDVIPEGAPVEVIGCLGGWDWCDVGWDGLRGWVAGEYLLRPGTAVYLPTWAPAVGLPVVSFSFDVYHDRYYRGRPWHRERRWAGFWRERREVRQERREDRQEALQQQRRQERRVEQRQERRVEQRQERRVEQRQERRVEQRQTRQRALQRQERRVEQRQPRQRALQRQERRGGGEGKQRKRQQQ